MDEFNKNDVQGSTDNQCNNKPKDWTNKLGEVFTGIMFVCAASAVVALTTKFIFWLF